MELDNKKLKALNNNILFNIKEIGKVVGGVNDKTIMPDVDYLIKLTNDLVKDINELKLIKSYSKEE